MGRGVSRVGPEHDTILYKGEVVKECPDTCECNGGAPEPERKGDPRFLAVLDEIESIHAVKQRDYGTEVDPFANVRASEELGIPGWIGCLIRMNDKMRRLNKAAAQVLAGGQVSMALDGPEDDFKDLSVYAAIGTVLFREGGSSQ